MTRYVSGDRVIYRQRDWKLSVVFFLAAVAMTAYPLTLDGRDRREARPAAGYGVMFVLGAVFLLSTRTILIDPARGICRIQERRAMTRTRSLEFPLNGVRVRTSMGEEAGGFSPGANRIHYIWIDPPGRLRIPFMGRLSRQEEVRERVLQLSRDLQIPGTPVG